MPQIKGCFFYLCFNIENNTVIIKIYEKRNEFDCDIVNFPNLDSDVPKNTSYRVYISQLLTNLSSLYESTGI